MTDKTALVPTARVAQALITLLDTHQLSVSGHLHRKLSSFDQKIRIAVTGTFKTGKSTLINRVFLRDNVLFADVLEAPAAPRRVLNFSLVRPLHMPGEFFHA